MNSRIVALLVSGTLLAPAADLVEAKGESRASLYVTRNPVYEKSKTGPKCNVALDVPGINPKTQKAKRNQVVEWIVIEGMGQEECTHYTDVTQIYFLFTGKKGNMGGKDPIPKRRWEGKDKIAATVDGKASNGLYGYDIYFDRVLAEDPELDINGDSPLGPGVPAN